VKSAVVALILMGCQMALAQGHCAKVSTEVTFYFGIETPVPEPNRPVSVDLWHTDLELSFRPMGWQILVSHDGPGTGTGGRDIWPEDALLLGNRASQWVLPSIPPDFEFIGARPGEAFWVLPQNAGTGALPLGIAVEQSDSPRLCSWNPGDARGADREDLWYAMQLLEVRGPADANFAMWQADGLRPPVVYVSTHEGGITDDDVFYIADGSHTHMNWGFTQAGLYEIDFRINTVLRCEEWLSADWAPLGDAYYNGDCKVDFLDFAHLAAQWLQPATAEDPNTWMFLDPGGLAGLADHGDLRRLNGQWLLCAYPGCAVADPNDFDPNEL
jgi:surface-anchored protein